MMQNYLSFLAISGKNIMYNKKTKINIVVKNHTEFINIYLV